MFLSSYYKWFIRLMNSKKGQTIEVVIMVTAYKRYPIGEMCLKGLARLSSFALSLNIRIIVVIVGSELFYEKLSKQYGFTFVYSNNNPLGEKHNVGLRYIIENIEFDYFMQMGSDDLLSNECLVTYKKYMQKGVPFFGLNELYIVNFQTKETKRVAANHVFGAGRCIKSEYVKLASDLVEIEYTKETGNPILDKDRPLGYKEYKARSMVKDSEYYTPTGKSSIHLWTAEKPRGLDMDSADRVQMVAGMPVIVPFDRPQLVDIKDGTNLNKFKAFADFDNAVFTDVKQRFKEIGF